MKKILVIILLLITTTFLFAQNIFPATGNVGIGTTTPGATYNLDIQNATNDPTLRMKGINANLLFGGGTHVSTWKLGPMNSSSSQFAITWDNNIYGGPRPVLQFYRYEANWDAQFGTTDRTLFGGTNLGVYGSIGASSMYLGLTTGSIGSFGTGSGLIFGAEGRIGARQMFIGAGTNANTLGLGTTVLLAVDGKIGARGVVVSLATPFPDYVFSSSYNLLALSEVEAYINQYAHLPEMPTAQEVKKDGIEIGQITTLLVKKVEELTLHMIEMNKKIEKLEKENQQLKNAN